MRQNKLVIMEKGDKSYMDLSPGKLLQKRNPSKKQKFSVQIIFIMICRFLIRVSAASIYGIKNIGKRVFR